jgi:hypothetical protein
VEIVAADGGNAAVDDLFTTPPAHESVLLDPFRVLSGDIESRPVAAPELAKGEKKFDSGEFGVVSWYLMLAERLPLGDALAAADGWGGDAYVSFERDGTPCARTTYVGVDAAATNLMESALKRWVAAAPGSPTTVSSADGAVRFESCDPGDSVSSGNDASTDALTLAAIRNRMALTFMKSGMAPETAPCVARRLVGAYTLPELTDPDFGAHHPEAPARTQTFIRSCRS